MPKLHWMPCGPQGCDPAPVDVRGERDDVGLPRVLTVVERDRERDARSRSPRSSRVPVGDPRRAASSVRQPRTWTRMMRGRDVGEPVVVPGLVERRHRQVGATLAGERGLDAVRVQLARVRGEVGVGRS